MVEHIHSGHALDPRFHYQASLLIPILLYLTGTYISIVFLVTKKALCEDTGNSDVAVSRLWQV